MLLVDDEAEILAAMEEFFADRYDIVKALDGQEAVVQVAAARPDLILLDLRLPGLDGFEVCRQLKSRSETDHIPIVMITALTATPDKVKGRMYGADEYLTKPVDLQYLGDTISRILAKAYG